MMRKEYDFSKAKPSPYAKRLKQSVTMRLDKTTMDYFKGLATKLDVSYQTVINLYLRDCDHRAPSGDALAAVALGCSLTNAAPDKRSAVARCARFLLDSLAD